MSHLLSSKVVARIKVVRRPFLELWDFVSYLLSSVFPVLFSVIKTEKEESFLSSYQTLKSESVNCSVLSDSLQPLGLQCSRLLCPWNSPGKNTAVGCHALFWGFFLTLDRTWVSCIEDRFFTAWATRNF